MALTRTQVEILYLAYFGRPPDFDGLNYYLAQPNAQVEDVARAFSASPEAQALYGGSLSAQIDAIYMNLFGRHAEPAGITYWTNAVVVGGESPAMLAYRIYVGAQGTDAVARTNKLAVVDAWVNHIDTTAEILGYSGLAANQVARDYLRTVTDVSSTLTNAMNNLDGAISNAVDAHNSGGQNVAVASSAPTVNEGDTVIFTISTSGVPAGTQYSYQLTGVNAADVVGGAGALAGTVTIDSNGLARVAVTLANDQATEGTESLKITVAGKESTVSVIDTSTAPLATYALAASAGSVDEGNSVIFTLTTTNVAPGSSFAYTLTGVSASDVVGGQLTGTAVVGADGKAIIQVNLAADNKTEGAETLKLSIAGKEATVTVNDTSLDPVKTYAVTAAAGSVNEGSSITFNIDTTNVAPGTTLAYTLTGVSAADVAGGSLTGTVMVGADGKASVTIGLVADASYQEGNEQMTLTLDGTGKSATVTVVDTSVEQNAWTLTTNQDVINSTIHNDTFTVANNTLGAGDVITDASTSDNDTMRVFTDNNYPGGTLFNTAPNYSGFTMSGVENLEVTSDDQRATSAAGATFDLSGTIGLKRIASINSSRAVTFNEVTGIAKVELSNLTNTNNTTDVNVHFADSVVAGATTVELDVFSSKVNTVQLGATSAGNTDKGVETVNLYVVGDSTITRLDTDLTTLNINNLQSNLTITTALNGTVQNVNASGATGNVSLSVAGAAGGVAITTGSGSDTITGSSNGDTINVGAGDNSVDAGAGNDTITATTGNNTIKGGSGADTITVTGNGNNVIDSGTESDTVTITGNGANSVTLSDGNNTLTVTGDGNNTVTSLGGLDSVTITGNGNNNVDVGSGNDTVTISGSGNNTVNAGAGDDAVTTGSGADSVTMGSGRDTISTGGGNDTIVAGANFDASWDGLSNASKQDVIDGGAGTNELQANAGSVDANWNQVSNIQTLTLQSAGTTTLQGNLSLPLGTNYAQRAGLQTINTSSAGNDTVLAGTFSSALTVNIANDGSTDQVVTGSANDTFNAFGDNNITNADTLNGGGGFDTLNLKGDTTLTTANNIDLIETWNLGSAGVGTSGNGYQYNIAESDATQVDGGKLTVDGSGLVRDANTAALGEQQETVTFNATGVTAYSVSVLTGAADDVVTDGGAADTIRTGAGNDTVNLSNGGNDVVELGAGNDVVNITAVGNVSVNGGDGVDTFNITSGVFNGSDTIDGGDAGTNVINMTGNNVDSQFGHTSHISTLQYVGGTTSVLSTNAQNAGIGSVSADWNFSSNIDASGYTAGLNLYGSSQNDTLKTGSGDDYVSTGYGNDSIETNGGNDTVQLLAGNHTVKLGAGDDKILTAGSDFDFNDVVDGGTGTDTIEVQNTTDNNYSVSVDLNKVTNVERFTVSSNGDVFTNVVDSQTTTFTFANGNVNTLTNIQVDGSVITDSADHLVVEWQNTVDADYTFNVKGSSGDDLFIKDNFGANNNITIQGGLGADTLRIHAGELGANIVFDGGNADNAIDTVEVSGGTVQDDDFVGVSNIERLTSSVGVTLMATLGSAADASGLSQIVTNASGSSVLLDPAFNNALAVTLGSGNDTINALNSSSVLTVSTSAGNVTAADAITGGTTASDEMRLTADNGIADLSNVTRIEKFTIVEGSGLADDANAGLSITNNTFTGVASGTITVDASALNDTGAFLPEGGLNLQAGGVTAGKFSVTGGTGADTIATGSGNDTISVGSGNDVVNAGDGNNAVSGTDGNKNVTTGSGIDVITLGNGNNTVSSGGGNDLVFVGSGSNQIDSGTGADTITQTGTSITTSFNVISTGDGNDVVSLENANAVNVIATGNGNDTISVAAGTNIITGGAGSDTITLGSGADYIRYTAIGDSYGLAATRDVVNGFDASMDKVQLETTVLGAGVTGTNFIGTASDSQEAQLGIALSAGDGIADAVYDASTGRILIDLNDDGVLNAQDLAIQMNGLVGTLSNANFFVIDTTPPAAPAITAVADDVGPFTTLSLANGAVTDDTMLAVSGTAEAGSTVTVMRDGVALGTALANGGGSWSFTVAAGTQGAHSITAYATDASANVGPVSSAFNYTLDTVAPTVVITDDEAAATANIAGGDVVYTFSFSEAPVGFTLADVTITGGTANGALTATADPKVFTLAVTPTAGVNAGVLSVSLAGGVATDAAGNANTASNVATQNYDTLAPVALGVALTTDSGTAGDSVTNSAALTITNGEIGALREYNVNGAGWSTTYSPVEGANAVQVRQTDAAGNVSPVSSVAFTLDTHAPTLTITDNQAAAKIGNPDGNVTFSFTFNEAVSGFDATDITVAGGTAGAFTAIDASHYTLVVTPTASVQNGTASVTINNSGAPVDLAGNALVTGQSASQAYDTLKPTITTASVVNTATPSDFFVTYTADPTLNLAANETVQKWQYNVNGNGWSDTYDTSLLNSTASSNNTVVVRAVDMVGNVSDPSANITFRYDAPPVITSTNVADNATGVAANTNLVATFSENIQFTATGSEGNVRLVDLSNANSVTAAQVTISGNQLTINPDVDLISGHHYAVVIDAASIEETSMPLLGNVDFAGLPSTTAWDFTVA